MTIIEGRKIKASNLMSGDIVRTNDGCEWTIERIVQGRAHAEGEWIPGHPLRTSYDLDEIEFLKNLDGTYTEVTP